MVFPVAMRKGDRLLCRDGRKWLVPQNEAYNPILLDGSKSARIYGRVKEIVKTAPRVASRLCAKAVKKMKMAIKDSREATRVVKKTIPAPPLQLVRLPLRQTMG